MSELTLVIGNKNYSSWSLRPWLALRQSGVPFVERNMDIEDPAAREEIRRVNPAGRVPALLHGDLLVWDSLAICEYAAETFRDARLWPADRNARAQARSACAEMHSGFQAMRGAMPMNVRRSAPGRGRADGVDGDVARITQLWQQCRKEHGAGGDMLFGRFSIADAFFAPVVSRFRTYGVDLDPVSQAYADAVWALPAMREWAAAAASEPAAIAKYEAV